MASRAEQLAKETGVLDTPHLAEAARQTKEYVAGIADDPEACPMLPTLSKYTCADELYFYIRGYLAGRIEAGGKKPTEREMDALGRNVINDPVVADLYVKTWLAAKDPPTGPFPCEY